MKWPNFQRPGRHRNLTFVLWLVPNLGIVLFVLVDFSDLGDAVPGQWTYLSSRVAYLMIPVAIKANESS